MPYTLAQLQDLLRLAGWPDVTIDTADGPAPLIPLFASFALAESSGDPSAHNPTGEDSYGLWQINRNAHPQYSVAQLTNPLTNAQLALQVYNSEGTRAWGVGPDWDGSYLSRGRYNDSLALYQQQNPQSAANITSGVWAPMPTTPQAPGTSTTLIVIAIAAVFGFVVARDAGII